MSGLCDGSNDVFHSEVLVKPLQYPANVSAIYTLLTILKTSIGPNGKLKIIQNFAGSHVTVTSSSSRLFHALPAKNFILKFVISSVRGHLCKFHDGGLYCALLILHLFKNASESTINSVLISTLYQHFGVIFVESLRLSCLNHIAEIDFSKFSHLKSIVKTILSSKPACTFTKKEEETLTVIIIKAFVDSVPDAVRDVQFISQHRVILYPFCGLSPSASKSLNGLLIKLTDWNQHLVSRFIKVLVSDKTLKVAIFSTCLSGDTGSFQGDTKECTSSLGTKIKEHLKKLAIKLICDGAEIVFCQKGILWDIKRQLEDNDILVLERLGTEQISNLKLMTGGVPVCSISDIRSITYGFVTSSELLDLKEEKYLLIQNEDRPFHTVLLCNANEEALDEMKIVCKQAVNALFRLACDPRVCCGGGCSEIYLSHVVKKKIIEEASQMAQSAGCSYAEVLQVLNSFISSIHDVALSLYDKPRICFLTETKFGHLWEMEQESFPSKGKTCKCGKYSAANIDSSEWLFLRKDILENSSSFLGLKDTNVLSEGTLQSFPSIMDELGVKINASAVAFESVASLLQIGLCIVSET